MIECILTRMGSEEVRTVSIELAESRTLTLLCPWHHELTPSCVISLDRALFYCFGCHTTGNVLLAGKMDEEALLKEYQAGAAHELLAANDPRTTNQAWWDAYRQYLASEQWREKRWKVLRRANDICEGCGEARATQVHHLTYKRVGQEMLFDLVAICDECHQSIHNHKE